MPETNNLSPTERVLAYHEATKHHFTRPARGPGFMDWANQPDPFRRYEGAELKLLPFPQSDDSPPYDALHAPTAIPPRPMDRPHVAQLFECALGLSAWKEYHGNRWELRCNPSSGNLHPTEGYLICGPEAGIADAAAVYHYAPREHGLELRARLPEAAWARLAQLPGRPSLLVGLSSVLWRETWKYGERAYRYCQHDVGHALAAMSYSAAALGWRVTPLLGVSDAAIAAMLGLDREQDFTGAEREEPDLIAAVTPADASPELHDDLDAALREAAEEATWHGKANRLSRQHMDWPIIDMCAETAHKPATAPPALCATGDAAAPTPEAVNAPTARKIFQQRRSAVAMDGKTGLSRARFYRMLGLTMPAPRAPWWSWRGNAAIHLLLFVHRVEDLTPGLYFLARDPAQLAGLRPLLDERLAWQTPPECPADLPLFMLAEGDLRPDAALVSCQQDIAGDGAFSLGMLSRFEQPLREEGPWRYRQLFWETGMVGQVLYLEAEANGLRATGIGCYFDDPVHELAGLQDKRLQSLYHFTVGGPVNDPRLRSLPPYSAERLRQG